MPKANNHKEHKKHKKHKEKIFSLGFLRVTLCSPCSLWFKIWVLFSTSDNFKIAF